MKSTFTSLNFNLTAALCAVTLFLPQPGFADKIDDLFDRLQSAEPRDAQRIEEELWIEWSNSGSPAMDLLLKRGRSAMQAGDMELAVQHLSALIDHAPDFAEGYNARATAYFRMGAYGPALADIQQTLVLNPRHFGALSGLAIMLDEMDKPRDALEAWKLVRAVNPDREGLAEAIERLEKQLGDQAL